MYRKKLLNKGVLTFISAVVGLSLQAQQSVPNGYEVAKWKGFRQCAVSYTFDDNYVSHYNTFAPMFEQRGFRMTSCVISGTNVGNAMSWSQIEDLHSRGHEISSHSVSHPNTAEGSEFSNSKSTIEGHTGSNECFSFAYPNCNTPNNGYDLLWSNYLAARTCSGQTNPSTPSNMMQVSSKIGGSSGVSNTSAFNSGVNGAANSGGWEVFLFHSANGEGYSPVDPNQLSGHLDYVAQNDSKFWVAPFGVVAKYIWERNAAIIEESVVSANEYNVSVSVLYSSGGVNSNVPLAVYNEPLSIKRTIPSGWAGVIVTINGQDVNAESDGSAVYFDAAPGDAVVLKNSNATVVDEEPPVITCPGDVSVEAESGATTITVNIGTASATDNDQVASVTSNAPSVFNVGVTTTVTWTATDVTGNTATCQQSVTVTEAAPLRYNSLVAGWNIIGCPLQGSHEIQEVLSEIWDKVEIIKDTEQFYDSSNAGLSTLTHFQFGQGYFIKVTEDCEYSW